jgi:hypothetical protein
LNLPPTSIRDLVVHHDDIVVGTHGRSFWILDNITPLRQLGGQWGTATAHLFTPQLTYRVRRNNNTDTPLPPEEPAGQNPPDGAMIDYWLKSAPSTPITLDIEDADGHAVRHFSSADKPETVNPKDFNVPMYWVRPPRTLSTEPGMHRFVWDLTYPAPEVLSRDYPISAIYHDTPLYPLGATVLPGKYTVKLTADGKTDTQTLEIRMDPRVKTAGDDLKALFELDRKIADALHRDYEAVQQIRSLRKQLKSLQASKPQLARQAAGLEEKLAALEGDEGGYGTRFLSTPEGRSLARLNTGFNMLVSVLDSSDNAPTTQQSAMFTELEKALTERLSIWEQLKSKDILDLNKQLKKSGVPELDPKKPVPSSPDNPQTKSQDEG